MVAWARGWFSLALPYCTQKEDGGRSRPSFELLDQVRPSGPPRRGVTRAEGGDRPSSNRIRGFWDDNNAHPGKPTPAPVGVGCTSPGVAPERKMWSDYAGRDAAKPGSLRRSGPSPMRQFLVAEQRGLMRSSEA